MSRDGIPTIMHSLRDACRSDDNGYSIGHYVRGEQLPLTHTNQEFHDSARPHQPHQPARQRVGHLRYARHTERF